MHQLAGLFADTVAGLPKVTAPTLVFRSTVDRVVPETSLAVLSQRIGTDALETVRLENSYHVATMDNDAPHDLRTVRRLLPGALRWSISQNRTPPDPSANDDDEAVWLDLVARLEATSSGVPETGRRTGIHGL